MIPVDQTMFGEGQGNCLQACIASVLELPLEAVPHCVLEDDWIGALQTFLARLGFWFCTIDADIANELGHIPAGYHLISGPSPRDSSIWHSVVGFQGKMVHDPHPSRAGLEKDETWDLFVWTFERGNRDGGNEIIGFVLRCRWRSNGRQLVEVLRRRESHDGEEATRVP